jgi:hypothetical protein
VRPWIDGVLRYSPTYVIGRSTGKDGKSKMTFSNMLALSIP